MRITYTVDAVCSRNTRVDAQKLTPIADGVVMPLAAAAASVAAGDVDAADATAAVAADAAAAADGATGPTIGIAGGFALAANRGTEGDDGRPANTLGMVQKGRSVGGGVKAG